MPAGGSPVARTAPEIMDAVADALLPLLHGEDPRALAFAVARIGGQMVGACHAHGLFAGTLGQAGDAAKIAFDAGLTHHLDAGKATPRG